MPEMQTSCVVSIATCDYLPRAFVLASTFIQHNPGCNVLLFVPDLSESATRRVAWPLPPSIRVLGLDAVADARLESMRAHFDAFELSCAAKSFVLKHATEALGYDKALWLDPDIACYAPFSQVWERLENNAMCVTPHSNSPMPRDGCAPDDRELLNSGFINGGFWAVRRGEASSRCLEWIQSKVEHFGFFLPDLNLYADQCWMSALPWMFPEQTRIIRDPGHNVAYWNLHERPLRLETNGLPVCGDVPLVFFHYSGFDHKNPAKLSRHSERRYAEESTRVLATMLNEYAVQLRRMAQELPSLTPDRPCTRLSISRRLDAYRALHGHRAELQLRSSDRLALQLKDWFRAVRGAD
jgi:hypothetical protein